jgi:YVTN family beta-propeller protein
MRAASFPCAATAAAAAAVLIAASSCTRPAASNLKAGDSLSAGLAGRLPTGVHLDPAAPLAPIWSMALTMRAAPEGDRVVVSSSGYNTQGLQVLDASSGQVLQAIPQRSAFVGLAFSPDGRSLYASGGDGDVVYRYDWAAGKATLRDSMRLDDKRVTHGYRYPAGLAVSPDGTMLYVAEDLSDSLAVIDLARGAVVQRLAAGRYPYDVAAAPNGRVYVSAWGGYEVSVYEPASNGLRFRETVRAARHPSSMQLNADGTRLYVASGSTDHVAVIDTRRDRVISRLLDPPPAGPGEGSTPDGLALSADGTRLFVAEADANAVAVFDLSAATSNVATATGDDRLSGRIPTGWYPTSLVTHGSDLLIATGKGMGTRANPQGPQPILPASATEAADRNRTLAQLVGGFMRVPLAQTSGPAVADLTRRVTVANGWDDSTARAHRYPPFTHVIYVIKENRTYDQVFGDLRQADGDTALEFFPRPVSPNHHALAERFGIFGRFFVNAEVSPDGHNWSTAAYATDYLEKTVPSNYSGRGRSYDYEGTNGGGFGMKSVPDDDAAEPANGYLWNLAEQKGITFRNYGEFVVPSGADPDDPLPAGYRGNKPFLYAHTNPDYPGFDLSIKDQKRADVWLAEFQGYVARGSLPTLEIIRLPNDHTSGARAGMPTPRAAFADNDLALGRMVDALSHSPFWKNTVMFVLEDDAQNGPDHVDSHRSPMLVISAWNRGGVMHRFANTTDVLRTMEEILGLSSMSQFDYFGRPLREIWSSTPDLTPYTALTPAISLDERNPGGTRNARDSEGLDLHVEDVANEELFNRVLWRAIKGDAVPYPGTRRLSARELRIGY